jgi:Cu-Zn family superoxide dismutase
VPRPIPSRRLSLALCVAAVGLFAASPVLAGDDRVSERGPIASYSAAVPPGSMGSVHVVYDSAGRSEITLQVWGLRPNTEYGAHAHQNACGLTGDAAGPHFQHFVDPVQPSVSPAYANKANEIWLDFITDAEGYASAQTVQSWQFEPDRRAHSVVIHEEHTHTGTHTGTGDSGTAGARLGCLTVDF